MMPIRGVSLIRTFCTNCSLLSVTFQGHFGSKSVCSFGGQLFDGDLGYGSRNKGVGWQKIKIQGGGGAAPPSLVQPAWNYDLGGLRRNQNPGDGAPKTLD